MINTGLNKLTYAKRNNLRTEKGYFAELQKVVGIVKQKTLKSQMTINYLVQKGDRVAGLSRIPITGINP